MTITFLSSKRFLGDENDTKPVNVPDGSIFYEIDSVDPAIITKFLRQSGSYVVIAQSS